MSDDLINKVLRLIALTENANANEARNAALQACKLIKKHKLSILAPGHYVQIEPPEPQPDFAQWETEVDNSQRPYKAPNYNKPNKRPTMVTRSFDTHQEMDQYIGDYKRAGYELEAEDESGVTLLRKKDGQKVRLDVAPDRERKTRPTSASEEGA